MARSASWTPDTNRGIINPPTQACAAPRPPKPAQPRDDGQNRSPNASYGVNGKGAILKHGPQPSNPGNGQHVTAAPQPRDDGTHRCMSGKPRPPPRPSSPPPRSSGGRRWRNLREPNDSQPRDPGTWWEAMCFCTLLRSCLTFIC